MKKQSLTWLGAVALVSGLSACVPEDPGPGQGSSNPGTSSSTGQSSSQSSSTGTDSTVAIQFHKAYTAIPDGQGNHYYEPAAINWAGFDRQASLEAFEDTLYEHLRSSGCAGCHSNDIGYGQAPLHSDGDVALAHEYALTRVDFHNPETSKFVERMTIDRHNCPGTSCEQAGQQMLSAVEDWLDQISHMIPEVPRGVPAGTTVSESEIKQWIESDKSSLPDNANWYVYTSLHELHNEGLSANELNIVRAGISKALNSAARFAPEVVNPVDINGKGLVYRFDIRDYWGWNQGVDELLFGGSDDDMAFAQETKKHYTGRDIVGTQGGGFGGGGGTPEQQKLYNFTGTTVKDVDHAVTIWQRVLHGNKEGAATNLAVLPPNIDGFHGKKSDDLGTGPYVKFSKNGNQWVNDLEWVEASQLVYTLTRPDVYNAVMMNPMQAEEFEDAMKIDRSQGMDSYDYILVEDAITIDSRLLWRAKRPEVTDRLGEGRGWYWKSWDVFTGNLESGRDRSIYEIYGSDSGNQDIRFPWWANPIPKFVDPRADRGDVNGTWSFIASLAQTSSQFGGQGQPFASSNTPGCDPVRGFVQGFENCRHYTGSGGAQQSASEIIYDLDNGLNGYYLTGGFNQRRLDAFINIVRDPRLIPNAGDDLVSRTGFAFSKEGGGRGGPNDPRLNVGSSCIGCHWHGMNRINNDLREWLDNNPDRLPSGEYGVDGWINDQQTVARVRELYPENEFWLRTIESDRRVFLESRGPIVEGMVMGDDKNMYVEPTIWTIEYSRTHYNYRLTTSN